MHIYRVFLLIQFTNNTKIPTVCTIEDRSTIEEICSNFFYKQTIALRSTSIIVTQQFVSYRFFLKSATHYDVTITEQSTKSYSRNDSSDYYWTV